MPLNQSDVVKYLAKAPPQHEAYQILAAYIYCKSSHGNLPTETLAKLLSLQRKILATGVPFNATSPIGRAFEAAKNQLLAVNRRYLQLGPAAFGPLGQIGSASSPDAIAAWTKATDGRVKVFDDGLSVGGRAVDAGRVVGPGAGGGGEDAPPPVYEAPPSSTTATTEPPSSTSTPNLQPPPPLFPDQNQATSRPSLEMDAQMLSRATLLSLDPSEQKVEKEIRDLELGREGLARLRVDMVRRQAEREREEEEERERRRGEEKLFSVSPAEGREEGSEVAGGGGGNGP